MPLDHYVSQVHLRQFCSPILEDRLHALRKDTLKYFTPTPKSVCCITDGSTNQYLTNDRAIEEFLKTIEPNYPAAIDALRTGEPNRQAIYTIAGFVAFIASCSPAAMRLHASPIKEGLEVSARILDAKGVLPSAPPRALGGDSLADLLDSGKAKFIIDSKYPQAIGIRQVLNQTVMLGNFNWEILINPFDDNAFFTSDFPTAFEKSSDLRILNRVVPLTPTLAVRICPNIHNQLKDVDFSFAKFGFRVKRLSRDQVVNINRLIVQSAESMIFFRNNHKWVETFVRRNARFRVEPRTLKFPGDNGTLLWFTHEISNVSSNSREIREHNTYSS